MTVERVGVSFEPELLEKFDDLIKSKGYTNRSEAIAIWSENQSLKHTLKVKMKMLLER
jgi:metal-responsive CopG/Arc/MetJ family transcriptional regulator